MSILFINLYWIYSGTYSGELAQFAKVEEKELYSDKNTPMNLEESTKSEEKTEKSDQLGDFKNSYENLSFSKFLSLSNDNSSDHIDWNFDNFNGNIFGKNDWPTQQNFEQQNNSFQNYKSQFDELSEDSIDFQGTKRGRKQQIRWRKDDDKRLFQTLMDALKVNNMDINQFCCLSLKESKPEILLELIERTGWKCSVTAFVQRIVKLYNSSRKLSWREMKKLRKLFYEQIKENSLDWNAIIYNFPGKSIDFLRLTCRKFKRTENYKEKAMGLVSRT